MSGIRQMYGESVIEDIVAETLIMLYGNSRMHLDTVYRIGEGDFGMLMPQIEKVRMIQRWENILRQAKTRLAIRRSGVLERELKIQIGSVHSAVISADNIKLESLRTAYLTALEYVKKDIGHHIDYFVYES